MDTSRDFVQPTDTTMARAVLRLCPRVQTMAGARRLCAQGGVWWEGETLRVVRESHAGEALMRAIHGEPEGKGA
jgi:hypothetical protein